MREDIEKIISGELDKIESSIEEESKPVGDDIQTMVDKHNQKLESELIDELGVNPSEKGVEE